MPDKIPPPSTIGLGYLFTKTFLAAITRLITSPFKGSKGAPSYFKDVAFAALRAQLRAVTLPQARYLNKPTTETYHELAKQRNFAPQSIDLPSGVQAHWLGNKNAQVTFVFFHGGGYVQPSTIGHFQYLLELITFLNNAGHSISCVVLAYTLAPEAEYPTQLCQAAELLHYLINTEHRSPSSLIIGGDSAGGNLTLSLLSHILHPHPGRPNAPSIPQITLSSPLRGALLYSPWVSFGTNHKSYIKNAESDMLPPSTLINWSSMFLGSSKRAGIVMGDSYSEPLLAETSWWSGASRAVDEVMIWGGGGEVFEDGLTAFAEKFTEGWVEGGGDKKKVTFLLTPRSAHDEPIIDVLLGYKNKGPAAIAIEDWVKARL